MSNSASLTTNTSVSNGLTATNIVIVSSSVPPTTQQQLPANIAHSNQMVLNWLQVFFKIIF